MLRARSSGPRLRAWREQGPRRHAEDDIDRHLPVSTAAIKAIMRAHRASGPQIAQQPSRGSRNCSHERAVPPITVGFWLGITSREAADVSSFIDGSPLSVNGSPSQSMNHRANV
jgi:hypothetical protein